MAEGKFGGRSKGGSRGEKVQGARYKAQGGDGRAKRAYSPRGEGFEKRPYRARNEGGEGAERPYRARREGFEGRERAPRRDFGDQAPRREKVQGARYKVQGGEGVEGRAYRPRGEGYAGGRDGGPRREYKPRGEGFEKRPYRARTEGGEGAERSYRPRREGFEGRERAPRRDFGDRAPRREFSPREDVRPGDGPRARFDGKRDMGKRVREPSVSGDGWLVGYHAVLSALKAGRRTVRKVWLLGEASGDLAVVLGSHPEWEVEVKARPDFDAEFGDAVHQGVAVLVGNLPQPSLPELLAAKPKLLVALDQVTDPHNLGAIVRSCAAFGAAGVLVTEHRSAGLSAAAAKAAAGAMETVPVVEVVNLVQGIEMLKEAGFTVLGLAGEAEEELGSREDKGPLCLVVGSEGDGLRRLTREHCDRLVKIAISSAVESLNVSVAAGVALSKVVR